MLVRKVFLQEVGHVPVAGVKALLACYVSGAGLLAPGVSCFQAVGQGELAWEAAAEEAA